MFSMKTSSTAWSISNRYDLQQISDKSMYLPDALLLRIRRAMINVEIFHIFKKISLTNQTNDDENRTDW